MISPRPFAKILYAADGEQVLFVTDKIGSTERLQAVTKNGDGGLVTHTLSFDQPGMAEQLLEACGQEQAEVMRRFGLSGQAGGMAALLQTAGTLQ